MPPGTAARGAAMIMALTAVAFFMVVLDALVVVTALPSIHRDLGGGLGTLQWTVNAYNIVSAAGIITAAALGDRLGRRRVYCTGLAIFTLGSALCAVAPGIGVLIGARVLQGLGAAAITPLSLTILTSAFPASRRGAITGIWGGISGLGVAAGPVIGGVVTQGLSWHWIFWVNVPFGVAAVIGARVFLPESFGSKVRLDLVGLALITVGVAALIWGLVEGPQHGWTSASVLVALLCGLGGLVGFVFWEGRVAAPMIPLSLFRVTTFSAAVTASFLLGAAIFSAAFLTSEFFQLAYHDSPLATGLRFLPWTGAPLVIAPLAGALSDRIGARSLIVPGLLLQAGGFAWIVAAAGSGYLRLLPALLIAGVGVSMAIPTSVAAALNAVPPSSVGKASAVFNTLRLFGWVAGIAVVTAVFNTRGGLGSPAAVTAGYRPAMATAAGLSVLAAVVALAIRSRQRASDAEPAVDAEGAGRGRLAVAASSRPADRPVAGHISDIS